MVAEQPTLARYGPAERRAMDVHKYFMGIELGRSPSMKEVVESWERNYAVQWRVKAMKEAAAAQLREIEAYRKELTSFEGRSIGFEEAAHDWTSRWGKAWRDNWEASYTI